MHSTCRATCVLLFAVSLLNSVVATAAPVTGGTGPGSVGMANGASSPQVWLRPEGLVGFSNNDPVSVWLDSSGFSRNTSSAGNPRPTYQGNAKNGNAVVRFDGAQLPFALSYTYTTGTVLAVAEYDFATFSDYDGLYNADNDPPSTYFTGNSGQSEWYSAPTHFTSRFVNADAIPPAGTIPTLNQYNIHTGVDSTPEQFTNWVVGRDRNQSGRNWTGDIAEVIVHDVALNTAQRLISENYLSSKFDVPLVTAANDHYAGDTLANGDFDRDVFGLGRFDASNQYTNANGPGTGVGSAGLGIQFNGVLTDNQWVFAGHDNGPNGTTNADMPQSVGRWERSWYIDTTGVGVVDLAFDWDDAGVTAPFDGSFIGLYFRPTNSGPFTLLSTGIIDIGNQRVDFSNVTLDLNDGYYTLGMVVPEPSTLTLLGLGVIGLAVRKRRRRCQAM